MDWFKTLLVAGAALWGTVGTGRAQAPPDDDRFRGAVFAAPRGDTRFLPAAGQGPLPGEEAVRRADFTQPPVPAQPTDIFDAGDAAQGREFVFGPEACPCPDPRATRVWFGAEVLLGTTRSVNIAPVVTTGPAAAGLLNAAAIGQPGTVPLFGGRRMLGDWRGGLRAEGGLWFDRAHDAGAVARFYSLYSTSDQLTGAGNGLNVVNVPQFVALGGTVVQVPAYVGFPGLTTGTVSATTQTMFAGGDLNVRLQTRQGRAWRVDALLGYRQLYLRDELGYGFTATGGVPPLAGLVTGGQSARTRNEFYGGNLGVLATAGGQRWLVEGLAAVALGVNASALDFDRSVVVAATGVPAVPLVATSTRDPMTYFGTVAEGGVRIGYRVTEHARLTVGYTALYWNNVRRAQDQVTLSPALTGATTHFFAHMLSCGAELRY
ncbi:BBP7 family outer membrane beta-barrel protein [Gemmata sp.]|uniref:BBP7 family outer membrane beta-barrel protein n=1 Tax=Gemmata sp. TaxID=1914242 RepID=UPI003F710025